MPLHDPLPAYSPRSNIEAHLACRVLRDARIEAWAIDDMATENGIGMEGRGVGRTTRCSRRRGQVSFLKVSAQAAPAADQLYR